MASSEIVDKPPKNYLIDMDGVLLRGSVPIPGAKEFLQRLQERDAKFLVLTNNSTYTPQDLALRLHRSGLDISPKFIYTSALAAANFLNSQHPKSTAYALGESGLTTALHDVGYRLTDVAPQYVVVGETVSYSFERITRAVRLVAEGSLFIATNRDTAGPGESGQLTPATGAVAALIATATGIDPYFIGKPNPLMMRTALNTLGVHSENSVMIGDTMATDIITGLEAGMETILVLTGFTTIEDVEKFPYRPSRIVESIADINP